MSGVAGFLLAQLPWRRIFKIGVSLAYTFGKPAVILYGLYRLAEDCQSRRCCGGTKDES